MMTSSNGNIFRVTGHLCGEFTGPGEFPVQRPVTRNFDVFFIFDWLNSWVNNREAGHLRRYRTDCDVIVMFGMILHPSWQMIKKNTSIMWNEAGTYARVITQCGLLTPYGDIGQGSALCQVMGFCLTAPSHYLNQCWPAIKGVDVTCTWEQLHREC